MATQFTTWPFSSSVGGTARTQPERIAEIYNVKEFGAVGDGLVDDTAAIQAAIDAAADAGALDDTRRGGIIFFPVGKYIVTSAITFGRSSLAGLRIIGSGTSQYGGTRIITNNQIYIFEVDKVGSQGGGQPFASIEYITFQNNFNPGAHGTIMSTETANGGFGCVYNIAGAEVRYESCNFYCPSGGICVFDTGISTIFNGCFISANFSQNGTHAEDSYGLIVASADVRDCTVKNCGTGITNSWPGSGSLILEQVNMENNGSAIIVGDLPISSFYTQGPDPGIIVGPEQTQSTNVTIRHIGCESNGTSDQSGFDAICRIRANHVIIDNCKWVAIMASASNGLYLYSVDRARISNFQIYDGGIGFATAAINVGSGGGAAGNIEFFGCRAENNGGPGVAWLFGTGGTGQGHVTFTDCNTDGAQALVDLPTIGLMFGAEQVCSNSDLATLSSNIGSVITSSGGANNKVVARWNTGQLAATSSWGSSQNTLAVTANPGYVLPGMTVRDITGGSSIVGTVASFAGTSLVLTSCAAFASIGSSDTLSFSAWCIAG